VRALALQTQIVIRVIRQRRRLMPSSPVLHELSKQRHAFLHPRDAFGHGMVRHGRLVAEGKNMPLERISIDPNVAHGQACVKGTRIPVHQIVRMLANGDTVDELLGEYPSLSRADIMACLDYAAALTEEQVTPIELAL
jgi:uncharacterized protein (DUF433 family)